MAPRDEFDIIVIGAGSGGLGISLFMASAGFRTMLVERSDAHIGGDCLNDGCVPSKAMIHAARTVHHAKKAAGFGIQVSGKVNGAAVARYIATRQDIIRQHENASHLETKGITVRLGEASFLSDDAITVNGEVCTARKIILATGSRPALPDIPGIEAVRKYTNESIFDLGHLPEKFLVIGGGPVGIEIGQALNRLGCKVTIVNRGPHILPRDAPEVSDILLAKLKEEGVQVLPESEIDHFEGPCTAAIRTKNKNNSKASFDAVFVAVGRNPDLAPLHLDRAKIEVRDGKIVTDAYLRTTNKKVWVCGDVAGDLKFSHAAEQHARLILNNLFSPVRKKLDNRHMSWVTFSDPQVATFGLSEKDLRDRKVRFEKLDIDFKDDDRAVVDDYRYGRLVLLVSEKKWFRKQVILGGTMVAPDAGELIQELILANVARLDMNELFDKVYPYPVSARINQALVVRYKEKQLTPGVKRMLRWVYRLRH